MSTRESPSSLARYLLVAYSLLVIYASLHPFSGWINPGVSPFAFLMAPLPRYLTAFDISANVIGYMPFGFFVVLALYPGLRGGTAAGVALTSGFALSLSVEALQTYLPTRFPSNIDVASNSVGALLGAIIAVVTTRLLLRDAGMQALRYRLFRPGARVDLGLVLLGLWLLSQLNPETLLFGNGDLRVLFQSTGGEHHAAEVFIRSEAAVVAANTLAVSLFATTLMRRGQPLRATILVVIATALCIRSFAYGLLFSAQDIFLWVTPGAMFGIAAGALTGVIAASFQLPVRIALAGLALMIATAVVNLAPENPYLTAVLAGWRQGHFLNLTGLTRVVSAIWPFAALAYLLSLASERSQGHRDG